MKLYSEGKNYKLYKGNSLDILEVVESNSIDSIVTDPPYELNFMSKSWDNSGIAFSVDIWKKCFEVLKPGGYLLAFGGTRTFHRIACAIEDAGFEIRDTIMWLYGSGFPKSLNIGLAIDKKNGIESETIGNGKSGISSRAYQSEETTTAGEYEIKKANNEWFGWGTALKPAYEPIIVARKPIENSVVDNVLKYGVGGINIDECRIGNEEISYFPTNLEEAHGNKFGNGAYMPKDTTKSPITHTGRFPSNVVLTYEETDKEEVCGGLPDTKSGGNINFDSVKNDSIYGSIPNRKGFYQNRVDSGSASRYFYCAKASKKDRDMGLNGFEEKQTTDGCIRSNSESARKFGANSALRKNIHPTVKPTELMQYLIRLVNPKDATILDIFNGSGSTGKAVMFENKEREANYKYIGVDLSDEYLAISQARIEFAEKYEEEQEIKVGDKVLQQMSFFDLLGDENEK